MPAGAVLCAVGESDCSVPCASLAEAFTLPSPAEPPPRPGVAPPDHRPPGGQHPLALRAASASASPSSRSPLRLSATLLLFSASSARLSASEVRLSASSARLRPPRCFFGPFGLAFWPPWRSFRLVVLLVLAHLPRLIGGGGHRFFGCLRAGPRAPEARGLPRAAFRRCVPRKTDACAKLESSGAIRSQTRSREAGQPGV